MTSLRMEKLRVIELDSLRPEIDLHLRSSFEMEPIEEEQLEQWEKKAADAGIAPEDFLVIKKGQCNCQGDGKSPDEDLVGLAQKMKEMNKSDGRQVERNGQIRRSFSSDGSAMPGSNGVDKVHLLAVEGRHQCHLDASVTHGIANSIRLFLPLNKINMEQSQLMAVRKIGRQKFAAQECRHNDCP